MFHAFSRIDAARVPILRFDSWGEASEVVADSRVGFVVLSATGGWWFTAARWRGVEEVAVTFSELVRGVMGVRGPAITNLSPGLSCIPRSVGAGYFRGCNGALRNTTTTLFRFGGTLVSTLCSVIPTMGPRTTCCRVCN